MNQLHDTQVGWRVLVRNLDVLSAVGVEEGSDREALRTKRRAERVTPLLPTRVMDRRGRVRDLPVEEPTSHRLSRGESPLFGLRRQYGDTLWSRTRSGQFRDHVVKSAGRNIEHVIERPNQ